MVIHPHFIKKMKMLYTSVIINAQVIALQIFFAIIEIWLFVCVWKCVFFSPIVNFPSSKVWYMDSWTVFFVRKYKLYADKWHNHYYNRSLSFILCEHTVYQLHAATFCWNLLILYIFCSWLGGCQHCGRTSRIYWQYPICSKGWSQVFPAIRLLFPPGKENVPLDKLAQDPSSVHIAVDIISSADI